MVTITYPVTDLDVWYHVTSGSTGFYPETPNLYCYNASRTKTITLNSDQLVQGGVFDRFGNKSVHHTELSMHIDLVTKPLNSSVTIKELSDGSRAALTKINKSVIHWQWLAGGPCTYAGDNYLRFKFKNEPSCTMSFETYWTGPGSVKGEKWIKYTQTKTVNGKSSVVKKKSVRTTLRFHVSAISESTAIQYARDVMSLVIGAAPDPDQSDIDRVIEQIWNGMGILDVNNIENALSLKKWRDLIPPIKDVILKHNIQSVSDLYLWYKYSFKTTELDARESIKFLQKELNRAKYPYTKVSGATTVSQIVGSTYGETTVRFHTYLSIRRSFLQQIGLDVNCSNLWDIIPFSFVLDWFVNIGDFFSALDRGSDLLRANFASIYQSRKKISRGCLYLPDKGGSVPYTYTRYSREKLDYLPISVPSLTLKNPFSHLVDGAALAISLRR